MKLKRLLTGLVAAIMLFGLAPAVGAEAPAATATGGFQDISDPEVYEAAELLRLLGVVSGTGNGFNPSGTLTRAEFCKMTVEIMGRGDEEPANRSRTIFKDVGSTHWARGYINLASSITLGGSSDKEQTSGDRLIMGVGNGNFEPDTRITYGSAVAILVRVLGYSNADVSIGAHWYDGYLAIASQIGLSDRLSLSGDADLTRGQAALLFENLLFTKSKGSDSIYLNQLNGTVTENTILLSTNATSKDNTTGAVQTTTGEAYKTERTDLSQDLEGMRGKLVLDKDKRVLAFQPDETDTIRRISVLGSAQADYVPIAGDQRLEVKLDTVIWQGDKAEPTTYEKIWTSLRTGTPMIFCYNAAGKLDYIYMPTEGEAAAETVMVARNKPNGATNPFEALAGGDKNYTIYKNGTPATAADIRQYDVATYDKASRIMYISDLRLTGLYENAYPNVTSPSTVTIMGAELTVLRSGMKDLSNFELGDKVTLLLTSNGQVAGAVDSSVASSTAVGVAKMNGTSATVELLDGVLTLKGDTDLNSVAAGKMNGRLVTVSSYRGGRISIAPVPSSGSSSSFDVVARTLGGRDLAENVKIFDQVGSATMGEVKLEDITVEVVPARQITYVGYDYAGRVSHLVLNDVTGDQYTYGFAEYVPAPNYEGSMENATISVKNGGTGLGPLDTGVPFVNKAAIGLAASPPQFTYDSSRVAGYVELTSLEGVHRASFDPDERLCSIPSMEIPISRYVWCYNESAGKWFTEGIDGLKEAIAFSDNMTIYYDKAPEEGGKIRLIVAK